MAAAGFLCSWMINFLGKRSVFCVLMWQQTAWMKLEGKTNTNIPELLSVCSPCIWECHSDELASVLGKWES